MGHSMNNAWLIVPVLLPMLSAPLLLLIRHPAMCWLLAVFAAAGSALTAGPLLELTATQAQHYHFGAWLPPVGIEFVLDAFNTPLLLLTGGAAALSLFAASPGVLQGPFAGREAVFYALFLLCLAGLNGILSTGDAFNVFVFLEISSLTTYALVAAGPRPGSALAAFQYLILGTLGGSFVLLGIGFWLQATGSLNMADLDLRLDDTAFPAVALAGTVLLMLGFALKAASFPLHQWLPAVYAAAPWPVTAFLAACATKIAIYALIRLTLIVGDMGSLGLDVLGVVSLVGIVWGALSACTQTDIRRLLAWSSVSQLAYVLFAFSLGTAAGVTAAFLQLFAHASIKGGIFLALGPAGSRRDLEGLRGRDPWRTLLLTLLILGLLGVPLTAGFSAKWALLGASYAAGHGLGLGVVVLSSLLAVIYCLRMLEPMWLAADPGPTPLQRITFAQSLPPLLALSAMFWLGTHSEVAALGMRAAAVFGYGGNP